MIQSRWIDKLTLRYAVGTALASILFYLKFKDILPKDNMFIVLVGGFCFVFIASLPMYIFYSARVFILKKNCKEDHNCCVGILSVFIFLMFILSILVFQLFYEKTLLISFVILLLLEFLLVLLCYNDLNSLYELNYKNALLRKPGMCNKDKDRINNELIDTLRENRENANAFGIVIFVCYFIELVDNFSSLLFQDDIVKGLIFVVSIWCLPGFLMFIIQFHYERFLLQHNQ